MPHPDPAIIAALLASAATPAPAGGAQLQATRYASADPDAADAQYVTLLRGPWELSICADGTHAELHCRDALITIPLRGGWPASLRALRALLADPRLDRLLARPDAPEE